MYYKLIKVIINILGLAKVIFDMVIRYYSNLKFITSNKSLVFILKSDYSYTTFSVLKSSLSMFSILKLISKYKIKIV